MDLKQLNELNFLFFLSIFYSYVEVLSLSYCRMNLSLKVSTFIMLVNDEHRRPLIGEIKPLMYGLSRCCFTS